MKKLLIAVLLAMIVTAFPAYAANVYTGKIYQNVKWEPNKYKVTYVVDSVECEADATYDAPLGEGYMEFVPDDKEVIRLYYTDDDGNQIDVDKDTIWKWEHDMVIEVQVGPKMFSITFVAADATEVSRVPIYTEGITAPLNPDTEGMTFKHWSATRDGEEYDMNTPVTSDLTLYAVYEPTLYNVTLNGGTVVPTLYGSPLTGFPEPEEDGKVFDGWYYDGAYEQAVSSTDTMPAHDLVLYAKMKVRTYKLKFDALPGEEQEYAHQATIADLPILTDEDKAFTGWFLGDDEVKDGDVFKWKEEITLTAHWKLKSFMVVKPNGEVEEKNKGAEVGSLPTPQDKPGMKFVGYKDQDGDWVTESTTVAKDMYIDYVFEPLQIQITLKDGDWSDTITVDAATKLELPDREKDGYTFKGWSTTDGSKVTTVGPFFNDLNLYAVFEGQKQQIYLEDLNQYVDRYVGDKIGGLPAAPGKDGHEFVGWLLNGELVTSTTTVPAGNVTLTAKYNAIVIEESNTAEIRYWSDNVKINTEDLAKGKRLWNPGAPPLDKVDQRGFSHWSETPEGAAYNFGERVDADVDLYAVWK